MEYTIDSVQILGNGNLEITYTKDSIQNTVEIQKEKIFNVTCGKPIK